MSEEPRYTEGICEDGAGILKDGMLMTIDEILKELNTNSEPDYKYSTYKKWAGYTPTPTNEAEELILEVSELAFEAARELK